MTPLTAITRRRRRRRMTTLVLALLGGAMLYAVGVGADVHDTSSLAAAVPTRQRSTEAPAIVAAFTAKDVTSKVAWRLGDERGHVVLLNFWATWCPPCRAETPDLVRVANQYLGKGLSVVGVSMDEGDEGPIHGFVGAFHIPYRIVRPETGQPLPFPVEALPTTFLIDRQGRLAKVYEGAVSGEMLTTDIDALLKEP